MSEAGVKPVINIDDVPLVPLKHAERFEARIGRVATLIGSTGIGCMVTVVPPGKAAFPFHVHHMTHELFFILEGSGEYRFGGERYPVRAGDICAAPVGGPDKAHQLINTGTGDLRYLGISSSNPQMPEVVEYPDSGKFAVVSQAPDGSPMKARIRYIGRLDTSLDYWDGEG